MTVIEISNPHRVAELPGDHPPPLLEQSPEVGTQLMAWYRWCAAQGEQAVMLLSPRTYRCTSTPLVWDAPNVSVMGVAPHATRIVTPGITTGTTAHDSTQRYERRSFSNFWVMSPTFFQRGQDGFFDFHGTGLTLGALFDAALSDIQVHGYGVGVRVTNRTARCHMTRVKVNHARAIGFHLQGSSFASSSGADFLVDNRFVSCEVDSNWERSHLTQNGWLLSGASIGDQMFTLCSALSCLIGMKVEETPSGVAGYRYNLNWDQCFLDYCYVACIDARDVADLRFTDGYIGVRGVVGVRAHRLTLRGNYMGMLKQGVEDRVHDAMHLADCHHPRIDGNAVRNFGRAVNLVRCRGGFVESNELGPFFDGSPNTPHGQAIRVTDCQGLQIVRGNQIDTAGNQLQSVILSERSRVLATDNFDQRGEPVHVTSAPTISQNGRSH